MDTVYAFLDGVGNVLYINRTSQAVPSPSDPWWPFATSCALEHFAIGESAIERESFLIGRHQPPFNRDPLANADSQVALYRDILHRRERLTQAREAMNLTPKRIRERRRKWRRMDNSARLTARCVSCLKRTAAPSFDGDCVSCGLSGDEIPGTHADKESPRRSDGREWGSIVDPYTRKELDQESCN